MTGTPRIPWQAKWVGLVLVWGASFLLMKLGLQALAPLQISTLRVVAGALVLLVLLRASQGRLPRDRTTWLHLHIVGFFLSAAPYSLFALAETRVSSALASIGNAVTPIATMLLTMAFVRDEHFSRPRLAGVLLGFLGVVCVMQPWALHEAPDLLGFAMTMAAGCCYGLGWTWHRLHLAPRDPGGLVVPTAQLLAGASQLVVALLIWWAVAGDRATPVSLRPTGPEASGALALTAVLVLGALGTGWAASAQLDVVRQAGATMGTSVTYLVPVVSMILGVMILGEHLGTWSVVGFVLVLSGALLIGYGNRWAAARRQRVSPTPPSGLV